MFYTNGLTISKLSIFIYSELKELEIRIYFTQASNNAIVTADTQFSYLKKQKFTQRNMLRTVKSKSPLPSHRLFD
jgi:hypothetical protein